MLRTLYTVSLMFLCSLALAQNKTPQNFFRDVNPSLISSEITKNLQASHFRLVSLELSQLSAELKKSEAGTHITLPLADGENRVFQVVKNSTLHPELNVKFPNIQTYDAHGVTEPSELGKLDLSTHGFHAMILSPGEAPVFIDPLSKGNTQLYIVYSKKNFTPSRQLKCGVHSQTSLIPFVSSSTNFANFNPCQLKKYRLALAATAEYTQYHGGTVAGALSAQATTINRVNGIYETEMAITMQIIANNNLIIYTNPNNQPYTHGEPELMIEENQQNVTRVIGAQNYDIGHVVDADGSGLAELASVCTDDTKAMGVTGTTNPVGDAFDIDFVAHEMGHQFGANHIQNNDCNRNDATAVEPGSGSTIMSYAGICPPNIQNHSDAYFNGVNLQEMGAFVSNPSHTCPIKTAIPQAPMVSNLRERVIVPAQTPFALKISATKSKGNEVLTYAWEQRNNEVVSQPPRSTATGGPNFRSFLPKKSGARFFPNLSDLHQGGPFTWEVLPAVSRVLKFRVSIRNNTPGGSCNAYADTIVAVTKQAGPFVVTNPTDKNIAWKGLTSQRVSWKVANTNLPPVNASKVNILLSLDGGASYPYLIASNVPNVGTNAICVPNVSTAKARILVQANDGSFFNISKNNFSISAAPSHAPVLTQADRNRMNIREAFVLYANCLPPSGMVYSVNGLSGATIRLDSANQRFIIGNISTSTSARITISAMDENHVIHTSNPITIPNIL